MKNKNIILGLLAAAVGYYFYKRNQNADAIAAYQGSQSLSNHWLPYPSMITPEAAAALQAAKYDARQTSFSTMVAIPTPDSFFTPDSFSLKLQEYRG